MRKRTQYLNLNFSKTVSIFLIVPIVFFSSFSFPRPAHADFFFFSYILGGILIANAVYCPLDVFWGCGSSSGGPTAPTVTVAAPAQPTATLSASPSTIDSGQSSTLTWSSENTTSCTAVGGFSTGGATSGSVSVGPLTTTQNYQISCATAGGSINSNTATVTVRVPTVTISAAPDRVVSGGVSTVSWSATNVNACTITRNGVAWQSLTSDTSRTLSSSAPDTVTAQTTYVISCTNNASSSAIAATATQIVNVTSSFSEF